MSKWYDKPTKILSMKKDIDYVMCIDENDNKPIGITLCTEKDNVMMEFALNGISNNLFTSSYTYYIPDKEQLINEVDKVLNGKE